MTCLLNTCVISYVISKETVNTPPFFITLPFFSTRPCYLRVNGPVQWARGNFALKRSAAARPGGIAVRGVEA